METVNRFGGRHLRSNQGIPQGRTLCNGLSDEKGSNININEHRRRIWARFGYIDTAQADALLSKTTTVRKMLRSLITSKKRALGERE